MVYIKTYIFNHFYYWQYLALLTMAPRDNCSYLLATSTSGLLAVLMAC